jgi:adenine-specific DNA-methyltransferase
MHGSIADVVSGAARYHVANCRAEALLDSLPDGCVSLVATDPPYHRVKMNEAWDREHATADGFLGWMGGMLDRFRRVLAPNGSLYVFASPRMAWGVEGEVRKRFEVLSSIRWRKPPHSTKAEMFRKEDLRAPFPASESVIFAEQRGADATAMGVAGYEAQCEAAKRAVFGDYLRAEMARAGVNGKTAAALFPSRTGGLTGCVSNWLLGLNCPTPDQYQAIRELLNATGGEFLRREYEDLRREYEDLRRPFTVSSSVPYTDVWDYPTVQRYSGKHSCEKPWAMGLDIVNASSRPGDIVLDCFAGSGCFPAAAVALGRRAIACDMDPHWAEVTRDRCARALESPALASRNTGLAPARREAMTLAAAPQASFGFL